MKKLNQIDYQQIYKTLNGLAALEVAADMPMTKLKGEKDTAFVKRIVAAYLAVISSRD